MAPLARFSPFSNSSLSFECVQRRLIWCIMPVTSWTVKGHEQLFLSKKSFLNGSKAIRGGIPIVFPQFGSVEGSKLPQHGFARISSWKLTKYTESEYEIAITFGLTPNELDPSLCALFNYKFILEYDITLTGTTLSTGLRVHNLDKKEFPFTWLLHTYIRVPALDKMSVFGLDGHSYQDKTRNMTTLTQTGDALTVHEEVDRIFANVPIKKRLSVVVDVTWNPWAEKAKGMVDFGDDEYPQMICVEVGNVASPVVIKPGVILEAGQVLRAMDSKLYK